MGLSGALRRARVLVCSSGGVGNMGDDAILLRTVERISTLAPRARVDVLTDDRNPVALAPAATVIGCNHDADRVDVGAYRVVVIAGGGFACEWFASHIDARLRIAERAAASGIPVILTGQGIGPFDGAPARRAVQALAQHANACAVRDELSGDLLGSFGVDAVLTGDDALGLTLGPRAARADDVVVHLRDASYHTTDPDARAAWIAAAAKVAELRHRRIIGLAVNDRPEAPEAATLRELGVAPVVDATRYPVLVADRVGRASAVVAHSYHVALFALAAGTPAVLAAANPYYRQKAEGLRRLAGVSDAFVVPDPPDARELAERLDAVAADLRANDALGRAARRVDEFFAEQWRQLIR